LATWAEFARSEPDFAELVQARFDAHKHKMMATLRKDGSPRISGIEARFEDGQLWLGMMPGSLKARDLQRDPRLALHNAPLDTEMSEGDAKLSGRAIEQTDNKTKSTFGDAFEDASGQDMPPGPFHLFSIDIQEVVLTRVAGEHLRIDTWREGRGLTNVERS
jgi:hypothetical protein